MPRITITGASDGIGAEIARQLAHIHGPHAQLVLAARNTTNLEAVALECRAAHAQVLVVPTDVSHEAACRALIAQAVQAYGGIDVLINNAGISAHAMFADVRAEHLQWYETLMRVNLWGTIWCTHAALPYLTASRGQIVGVASHWQAWSACRGAQPIAPANLPWQVFWKRCAQNSNPQASA